MTSRAVAIFTSQSTFHRITRCLSRPFPPTPPRGPEVSHLSQARYQAPHPRPRGSGHIRGCRICNPVHFTLAEARDRNHAADPHRSVRRRANHLHLGQPQRDGRIIAVSGSQSGGSGLDLIPGGCIRRCGGLSARALALGPRAALRRSEESIPHARFVGGPTPWHLRPGRSSQQRSYPVAIMRAGACSAIRWRRNRIASLS